MATYDALFDGEPIWNASKTRDQLLAKGFDATALQDSWVNVYRHALGVDPVESKFLIPYSVALRHADQWGSTLIGGTLTLRQDAETRVFQGLKIVHGTPIGPLPAGYDPTRTPYLASVYDGRWFLQMFTVDKQYNLRRRIDPDSYAPHDYWHKHSRNANNNYEPWTWAEILTDLWSSVLTILGPLDLSGFVPPPYHPEQYDFGNVRVIDALRQVLADSFSTLRPDALAADAKFSVMTSGIESISEPGAEDWFSLYRSLAPYLKADIPNDSMHFIPEKVRVVFPALNFDYTNTGIETDIYDAVEKHQRQPQYVVDIETSQFASRFNRPTPPIGSIIPVHAPRFARYTIQSVFGATQVANSAELTAYANAMASKFVMDRVAKSPERRVRFHHLLFEASLNPRIREIDYYLASRPDRGVGTQIIESPYGEAVYRTNLSAESGEAHAKMDGSIPSIMPMQLAEDLPSDGDAEAHLLYWREDLEGDLVSDTLNNKPIQVRDAMGLSRVAGNRGIGFYHPQSKQILFMSGTGERLITTPADYVKYRMREGQVHPEAFSDITDPDEWEVHPAYATNGGVGYPPTEVWIGPINLGSSDTWYLGDPEAVGVRRGVGIGALCGMPTFHLFKKGLYRLDASFEIDAGDPWYFSCEPCDGCWSPPYLADLKGSLSLRGAGVIEGVSTSLVTIGHDIVHFKVENDVFTAECSTWPNGRYGTPCLPVDPQNPPTGEDFGYPSILHCGWTSTNGNGKLQVRLALYLWVEHDAGPIPEDTSGTPDTAGTGLVENCVQFVLAFGTQGDASVGGGGYNITRPFVEIERIGSTFESYPNPDGGCEATCEPDTGVTADDRITSPCCPDDGVPGTLYLKWDGLNTGTSGPPDPGPGSVALTYDGAIWYGEGTAEGCEAQTLNNTVSLVCVCNEALCTWTLTITNETGTTQVFGGTPASCNPFSLGWINDIYWGCYPMINGRVEETP